MPRNKQPRISLSLNQLFPLVFGGVFVLFGMVFLYFLGIQTSLECRKAETVDCVLRSTWLGLFDVGRQEVKNLTNSWVDSRCDEEGCSYWTVLTTAEDGYVRFSESSSSDRDPHGLISKQINAALQDKAQRSFRVSSQDGWWVILPIVFILIGALILFLGLRVLPRLFKNAN